MLPANHYYENFSVLLEKKLLHFWILFDDFKIRNSEITQISRVLETILEGIAVNGHYSL